MRTNLFNPYKITAAICLMLSCLTAAAQQGQQKNIKDTSSAKLAAAMSVSKGRAEQIRAALNYKHDEVRRLMRDSSMSVSEKRLRLQHLVMERQRRVDSLITPAEKTKFKQAIGDLSPKQKAHLAEVAKRQETQLNRVPHRQAIKASAKDSVKRIPKVN
ncbi:hypothetical protein HQ865_22715 [Mucilaginibacter mali]|uniref:Periplasmic heavy metal sensor n=1 Tax=Mucilaginibacter mali TaxID=2740462 RepID=A0A7D4TXL0_9SPHI|nr:hypothetical protein [Mucilaginibacter mali]QKJ32455.1 hypothetical protein HQ865_22715 [Mucilaginibacter mali]